MYCNYCRTTNADDSFFCRSCGKSIAPMGASSTNAADQPADRTEVPQAEIQLGKVQPSGVGGWLGLLIFGLVIGGPLSLAAAAATGGAVAVFLCIGLAVWSIYCGVVLIRKKPNAPRITKIYLVTLFCLYLLAVGGTIAQSVASPASVDVADDGGRVLGALLMTLVWYAYLEKSKRVKNTYQSPSIV